MPFSVDRFLTTHTGSLPRPDDLVQMMYGKEEGKEVDIAALHKRTTTAVREVVDKQRQAGLDIINDGEMSKPSYATYVKDRLDGFGGTGNSFIYGDLVEFPKLAEKVFGARLKSNEAWRMAVAEILSHLEYLRYDGQVEQQKTTEGLILYAAV